MTIGSSTSILGPNIPASTKDTFVSHLASYNMWALQGERGWAGSLSSGWASEELVPLFVGQESDCNVFLLLLQVWRFMF